MPDIGFGEIVVIIVIALLVFGPDRLPKMAADAARTLRQVRQMAASARKDLVDAAGLEGDGEMAQTMKDLRDLDPRQAMNGVLTDDPATGGAGGPQAAAAGARQRRAGTPALRGKGPQGPGGGPGNGLPRGARARRRRGGSAAELRPRRRPAAGGLPRPARGRPRR